MAATAIAATTTAASAREPLSVFIPYTNVAVSETGLNGSPKLPVSFNGGTSTDFTMDTGSTGTLASPDIFTPPPGEKPIRRGSMTYTSSGRKLLGDYFWADVQIGTGLQSVVSRVPVLRVDRIVCLAHARDCKRNNNPTGVAMMGVGFGRGSDDKLDRTPKHNPFLNIKAIAGQPASPIRGYSLSWRGVTLGITKGLVRQFHTVQLTWDPTYRDWSSAPLTLSVNGWTGTGSLLMDTGVEYMYLRPPTAADTVPTIAPGEESKTCLDLGPCAAPGVVIQIAIGNGVSYKFRVGPDGVPNPAQRAAPGWVTVLKPGSGGAFVNTSYHFLNRFDYLYDFTAGLVGFRPSVITD